MASIIEIPRSNTLRMVNENSPQNFDNTLFQDEDFLNYVRTMDYYQKVKSTDTIAMQFNTDASVVTAIVYDKQGNQVSDKTADLVEVLSYANFTTYELEFQIGAAGVYYLELTFDSETYISELFQIDGFSNTVEIEYNTSENDGVNYINNISFVINAEGRLTEYQAGQEKEVYKSFGQRLVNLKSYPLRVFLLELSGLPRYMVEKINIALAHEVIKINGVEYQNEQELEVSVIKDTYTITDKYNARAQMRQVDYENYETSIVEEDPDTFRILQNSNLDLLTINEAGDHIIYKS